MSAVQPFALAQAVNFDRNVQTAMFVPLKVGGFIAAERTTGMAAGAGADASRRSLSAAVAAVKAGPLVRREAEWVARSWVSGPASDGRQVLLVRQRRCFVAAARKVRLIRLLWDRAHSQR